MPRLTQTAERLCWTIAILCAVWIAFSRHQVLAARKAAAVVSSAASVRPGPVIGRMEIGKLGLSVPILDDDDTDSLRQGLGHIPGTAFPGGLGTVGLAGHRDTFLRPLQQIAPAMDITVSRGKALYHYSVDSTEIVKPEAVRVLDTQDTPELVLVTCYPFHYIGAAPLRFIVHAHLVSLTPDQAGQ